MYYTYSYGSNAAQLNFGNNNDLITGAATSQVGNFTAAVQTYISCTWSDSSLNVSFGSSLNPNTNDINASLNYVVAAANITWYNVTVDTLSNVVGNITVQGADFISGANRLGITNITWASNTTNSSGVNMQASSSTVLTTSYDIANVVALNEPIGSTAWFRFWLDVPSGQLSGTYNGNYTMQCQQGS